ncbi:uncharacterized protein LOC143301393 [Babylonia areolata]|uniref:uncharacterized protein LOC143301393 n=1 Tax=Babylonia areolata TaxID=304850 RepID=UPI003FD20A77
MTTSATLVLLCALWCAGDAIRCYHCDNDESPSCGNDFKWYQFDAMECSPDTPDGYKCGKQEQLPNADGWVGVIRRCYPLGQLQGINESNGCHRWFNPVLNFTALYCFCDRDFCNAARSHVAPSSTLLFWAALLLALLLPPSSSSSSSCPGRGPDEDFTSGNALLRSSASSPRTVSGRRVAGIKRKSGPEGSVRGPGDRNRKCRAGRFIARFLLRATGSCEAEAEVVTSLRRARPANQGRFVSGGTQRRQP